MIEIETLRKRYGQFELNLKKLSLPEVGIIGLIGGNGAGKTTLLKILTGRNQADELQAVIFGETKPFHNGRVAENIFYVSEETRFQGKVRAIVADFSILQKNFDPSVAFKYFERLTVDTNKTFRQLSGGMKSKVKLALVAATDAKAIFADEITNGLDVASRKIFYEGLKRIAERKLILFSSHILDQPEDYFDRILFLQKGKLVWNLSKNQRLKMNSDGNYYAVLKEGPGEKLGIGELYEMLCETEAEEVFDET